MDKVYVRTLGGFDLHYRGELIYFFNSKAKELLAVLVDWRDKAVMLAHLAEVLLEGERDEAAARQAIRLVWHRLKQTLRKHGIKRIVIKGRGTYVVNREQAAYSSYDVMRQVEGVSNYFAGEYIPEYSWAEVALSSLVRDYFEEGFQEDSELNVQRDKQ